MGGSQSTPIPGGGTHGYHVLKVQDNSPAHLSQLEAYFDFIVTIQGLRLDQESDTLIEILKVHLNKQVLLGVYNIKGRSWREVGLTPSTKWGGQGVIGVSIRFCSFENVSENIWHILEVYSNSPAEKAGLCSNTDYIIGYEMMEEEFDTFIEQNNRREVKLFVYNVASDKCRDIVIMPDQNWGGEGSLGCGVGTGYLHRIPIVAKGSAARDNSSIPRKSDVEVGDNRDRRVRDFASDSLVPPPPPPPPPPRINTQESAEREQADIEKPQIPTEQSFPQTDTQDLTPHISSQSLMPQVPLSDPAPPIQRQESPRESIPTASQRNLFAPTAVISPSSGLPTAPPSEFDLEIPSGSFYHSQQPTYPPDHSFKPLPGTSQPNYTAVSPPSIEDTPPQSN